MLANNACASVAPGPPTTPINSLTNSASTILTPSTVSITSSGGVDDVNGGGCGGSGSGEDKTSSSSEISSLVPNFAPSQSQTPQAITPVVTSSVATVPATSDSAATASTETTSTVVETTLTTTTETNIGEASTTTAVKPFNSATKNNDDNPKTDFIGPIVKRSKARPTPFSKPILLSADRRNRKKKSITWQCDERIQRVHYFELIPDERGNVTRDPNNHPNAVAVNNSALSGLSPGSSPNAHANRLDPAQIAQAAAEAQNESEARSSNGFKRREWRLIKIDHHLDLPGPGWNSVERSAQAERENYVLGAIDLPGQPAILDEPDANETSSTVLRNEQGIKIIPLENPDGMCTVYPDLSNSEIVNGVRVPPPGSQPLGQNLSGPFDSCQPTQLMLPGGALQPQMINNIAQNPFSFQEMSAQFQPQQQQPFPFMQQQFQTPFVTQAQPMQANQPTPFINQQQQQQQNQQQTGPITPWMNYPFSQVNENSHLQLYRRPAT